MTDLIGQTLGRYHILEQLGEGGMATVYKAYDTGLERNVAIKIIRRGAFPPDQLERILKRFEREAKALGRLSHPNIVGVIDYGEFENSPYLVMVYLPGGTLKQRLGKPIPWHEAAHMLSPIAIALQYAHEQGIIHRDVKPSNILVTHSGEMMLSDFGIAKILESEETQTQLTGTGIGVGTPEYMAPEQWTGQAGPQADIYSMGVILYEMVTGRKPYMADTPAAILLKQASDPLPRPQQFVPGLPEGVEKVLIKALAKNAANRYIDMHSFAAALDELASGQTPGTSGRELSSGLADFVNRPIQDRTTMDLLDVPGASQKPASWKKWLLPVGILAGVACLLLVIGGAVLLSKQLRPQPTVNIALDTPAFPTEVPAAAQSASAPQAPAATQPPVISANNTSRPTTRPSDTPVPSDTTKPTNTPVPVLGAGSSMTSSMDGMLLLYVQAGNFTMGANASDAEAQCLRVSNQTQCDTIAFSDEAPAHPVTLNAYWIDQTEVTNAMYSQCNQASKCSQNNSGSNNNPVVNVTWSDASTYCAWAGRRLPTEAEWEKAARGTDQRVFPWGRSSPSCSMANYTISNGGSCAGYAAVAVGSFSSSVSPYGALDMAGNVWEWVNDWFAPGYSSAAQSNPTGPASGNRRVMRGGSYMNSEGYLTTTGRGSYSPNNKLGAIGFRCAANP